jgi:3-oxoacyl-[acyl-carrier-protein] synthase-3
MVATMTPDHYTPSTACIVQAKLGCVAGAMDMNAACSGFLYALFTACQFVKTGSYRRVLVVGAETMSMIADPEDKKTYPLFGDGAAALLIGPDPNPDESQASGLLAFRLASVGELRDSLVVPGGGSRQPASMEMILQRNQFLKMDGRSVFKWAVRLIPEMVREMLEVTGLSTREIDLLVLHQANLRIINAAMDTLGIEPSKVFVNVDRYGNTSAASVPISIHEAWRDGMIKRGDNIMLGGFGAGLTWASCVFRW